MLQSVPQTRDINTQHLLIKFFSQMFIENSESFRIVQNAVRACIIYHMWNSLEKDMRICILGSNCFYKILFLTLSWCLPAKIMLSVEPF